MKVLIGFAIILLACECSLGYEISRLDLIIPDPSEEFPKFTQASRGGRVSQGMQAAAGQFPFTARLEYLYEIYIICSGSLLSKNFVLGARHCVGNDLKTLAVALGAGDWDHPQLKVYGKTIYYITNNDGADVTLIQLNTNVFFNTNIQPVRLPPKSAATYENTLAFVTGWGGVTGGAWPRFSQFTTLKVISNPDCVRLYNNGWNDPVRMCAVGLTDAKQGICGGDNGAGLVAMENDGQYTIIGIGLAPLVNCAAGSASVFTRIAPFLQYISDVTQIALR